MLPDLGVLNRSLCANKVRDNCRHGRVETNHVQHAAVVRVGEGEAVGGHAYNDWLRVADELAAILTQRLRRMNVARPRFAVRVRSAESEFGLFAEKNGSFGCRRNDLSVGNSS